MWDANSKKKTGMYHYRIIKREKNKPEKENSWEGSKRREIRLISEK